jgi:radical SAM superfamily enzyme YgiQ (UPF0313 family)
MKNTNQLNKQKISVIGIIPQYPKHSQYNVYANVKMPPVGIISVLSQIKDKPIFKEVYAIDENNYAGPLDFMNLPEHNFLQEKEPAKIAMFYGGMSNSIPRMFSLAKQYKKFNAITIAGGSHADALPEEALNSGVDIVVHGEGEETIKELIKVIVKKGRAKLNKNNLSKIKGISFLNEKQKYVFTGKRNPIKNLDKLKDPDLTIIKFLKKRWSAIPLSKGRGCNWNCEFCVVNKLYGKYKSCSVEKVLKQIIKYSDLGYEYFFFTDDNFCQNAKETIELCRKIGHYKKEFNKKIRLMVQVRSEIAENDELIEAMKYAGIDTLAIGFESPINEELKIMNKGVTAEKLIERSIKLSEHFYIHGMFIFGYPVFKDSEHKSNLNLKQKAEAYNKFFRASKIDTIQVLNAGPAPGSELRRKLEKENRIFPLEKVGWDKYDGLFLCYDPSPEGIDAYDLQNIPRILMKKRYLGGFLNEKLNYFNWMNWAYNATIGFPIQFSVFYAKRFIHNYNERRRRKIIQKDSSEKSEKNIFYKSLINSWKDICRIWRNLATKTYAGQICRNWLKHYRKTDYSKNLIEFSKNRYGNGNGIKVAVDG